MRDTHIFANFVVAKSQSMDKDKETMSSDNTPRRARLGIALSGGGARGFAHAGALAAIEEAGFKPDIIAGVSAGSIVAALYAAGIGPKQFLEIFSKKSFTKLVDFRPRGGGLFSMQPFKKFLEHNLGEYKNLEELPIPVYIGVTNFTDGVPEEFHTGAIADRVLASCAIPITFAPVIINDTEYVDGGVLRNHPAWIIRDKCDYLIGVNVSPLTQKKRADSFLSVAMRTYNLWAKANQREDMALCDLNIAPLEITHYGPFDLRYINNVYMSGYVHTRKALRDAGLWHSPLPIK